MEITFTRYPSIFQNAIAFYLKKNPIDLDDFPRRNSNIIEISKSQPYKKISAGEIVNPVWFRAMVTPCFFIGAAVKNNDGMVDRAVAGHIGAQLDSYYVQRVLSGLLPIAPGKTISAFIAGSSGRNTKEWFLRDVNTIKKEFDLIGLPLEVDVTEWWHPIIRDKIKDRVISDLGNMSEVDEKWFYRRIYFGVTREDCMLFSSHLISEGGSSRYIGTRIITPDIGFIDFPPL